MTTPQPTLKELDRLISFHAGTIRDAVEYPILKAMTQDEMETTIERLRDLVYARRSLSSEKNEEAT